MPIKKNRKIEKSLIIVWIIANLLIGLKVVGDYGISIDEPAYFLYAEKSTEAYGSMFGQLYEPDYGPSNHRYYGPAFIMGIEGILRLLKLFDTQIDPIHVWHYAYFCLFQFTGLCLFALAKRWFEPLAAWGVLVLFSTQPLLWGHAFINPKDIPFMFFFSLSIFLGYRMVDQISDQTSIFPEDTIKPFREIWGQIATSRRKKFLTTVTFLIFCLAISIIFVDPLIEKFIGYIYFADQGSWAAKIMPRFATNFSDFPLANYVSKAQKIYTRFEIIFLLFTFFVANTYLFFPIIPKAIRKIQSYHWQKPGHDLLKTIISSKSIAAGIALGLTTSIRVLGPLAGFIVILYLFSKGKRKFLLVSLGYFGWAAITTYLTWPFLWLAPIKRYFETFQVMSNFPWQGQVLFNGEFYNPSDLPRSYLPILMNIQFSEIFLIFFYVGIFIFLWKLLKNGIGIDLFLLVTLGGILPIIGITIINPPMYDNFRQLFFLLPGLFMLTAYTFTAIFKIVSKNWLRIGIIGATALTGIWPILQLHPYEYIYYNSFVGGVEGAFRQFELDYWQTSTRELVLELNKLATSDEKVIVNGSLRIIRYYIRPDLFFERTGAESNNINGEYDYAVLFSRWNDDQKYPDAEVLKIVERNGAVLGVVKQVSGKSFE